MQRPRVILLNGVGSVGKTSVAKALQDVAATPLLHVSMDTFIEMVPARLIGQPEGITFDTKVIEGVALTSIRTGQIFERVLSGMRRAVVALAERGNSLVVDDVWVGRGEAEEYRSLLAAYEVRLIGLFAPLNVLEDRERARGDRMLGLARWEFDRVHVGVSYDLEIDTGRSSPEEVAKTIARTFGL